MQFLRSNTAVIVTVGPFYDKTDGVTIETALTITNERITLTADTDAGSAPTNILDNVTGATSATSNDLNYITGNDAGMMQLELSAANVNRVGRMLLSITDAANHVPVFHEYFVLPQAIFDWLTGVIVPLPANVTQLLGTAWLTPGVAGTPDVNTKTMATGALTAAAIAADAITAAKVAADVSTEIANAVLDTDMTGHQTQGTLGQAIGDPVADTNTIYKAVVTDATGATVGVDVVAVKAETASLQTDTNDIQARLPAALTAGGNMKADALAWNALATVALPLIPTVAGRTLDVSVGGEAGVDWANIGSPTTAQNLSGTLISGAQTVAVTQIGDDVINGTTFAASALAAINAEVVDALNVDTYAEPGQEAPPATTTLVKKIGYLYKFLRNKKTQTATLLNIFNDDAATVDQKATVSDDGTTLTSGEIGTGP